MYFCFSKWGYPSSPCEDLECISKQTLPGNRASLERIRSKFWESVHLVLDAGPDGGKTYVQMGAVEGMTMDKPPQVGM